MVSWSRIHELTSQLIESLETQADDPVGLEMTRMFAGGLAHILAGTMGTIEKLARMERQAIRARQQIEEARRVLH